MAEVSFSVIPAKHSVIYPVDLPEICVSARFNLYCDLCGKSWPVGQTHIQSHRDVLIKHLTDYHPELIPDQIKDIDT